VKSKDDLIDIKSIKNDNLGGSKPEFLNAQAAKRARKFHSSFKEYRATPLTSLKHLAEYLGIKNIYVKDDTVAYAIKKAEENNWHLVQDTAWEILRVYAHMFISCNDHVSSRGMRILANPIADDKQIISGGSGFVGLGLLSLLMEKENLRSLKNELQLDENSIVLIFNTEGATDTVNYRKIVWDGKDSLLD